MFRPKNPQSQLFSARNQYRDLIDEKSFYARLAEHGDRLFADARFSAIYCPNNGRPCVPPSQMFMLLLLQLHDRCSDEEAVDRARFDIRWATALDLELGRGLCGRSTFIDFRARLHLSEVAEECFRAVLQEAWRVGLVKTSKLKVVLDTTPVLGRGAVKDTYNLVAHGICRLGSAVAAVEGIKAELWAAEHDLASYWTAKSVKGEADIDWSDDQERRLFLNRLVIDARRLMVAAERVKPRASSKQAVEIDAASDLLRRLISQDTEPDPGPAGKRSARKAEKPGSEQKTGETESSPSGPLADGQQNEPTTVRIREGVARDRVISVTDPEMRHGRKSASKRFDGAKLAIAVEAETGLILAVDVLPGNAPDDQGSLELTLAAGTNTELRVEQASGDCAYGSGANRQRFLMAGIDLLAKVPHAPAGDEYHKSRFVIDLTNKIATCPVGQATTLTSHSLPTENGDRRITGFQFNAQVCSQCPSRTACLRNPESNAGRTITVHPQEELLQEARARQADPQIRRKLKERSIVERELARMVHFGMRQARYFGHRKTRLQALLTALVVNFQKTGVAALFPTNQASLLPPQHHLCALFVHPAQFQHIRWREREEMPRTVWVSCQWAQRPGFRHAS